VLFGQHLLSTPPPPPSALPPPPQLHGNISWRDNFSSRTVGCTPPEKIMDEIQKGGPSQSLTLG